MNKKKPTPKNTNPFNVDEMRQSVIEQELSARSWKAWYEKMYYSMECEKIEPTYKEYQERMRVRMEEENKRREEFMKILQDAELKNKDGELKVETVSDVAKEPAMHIVKSDENE